MATLPTVDFTLKYERRLCKVKSELGYFHCWEHFSEPVPAGLTIGSPPAGVISYVVGIVEFDDGVRRVDPTEIKFCDEEHANLCALNKYEKEHDTNEKNERLIGIRPYQTSTGDWHLELTYAYEDKKASIT